MVASNPEPTSPPIAEIVVSEVIAGVLMVYPRVHTDERGYFVESYRRSWFPDRREMVQGNRSDKQAGTIVGLHYHLHQADYWYVTRGLVRVVLHDLREGSPTEGATLQVDIGDGQEQGVYIPPGVAHGFAALTDATVTYLVDQYYSPDDELGVTWDDPGVNADWGVAEPVLSARDQGNPRRTNIPRGIQPMYGPGPVP